MASDLDIFLAALRGQESGGNYTIVNAGSGASGAYQFTFGTWVSALTAAGFGGTVYAREQAADAPPSVQDAAASQLVSTYFNDYGHSWYNVAEAWYGGPGAVGHPNIGGGPGYPTVGQYASQVIARYNALGGSGDPVVTTTIPNAPGVGNTFSQEMADYYRNTISPQITASKQWALLLHNIPKTAGGVLV